VGSGVRGQVDKRDLRLSAWLIDAVADERVRTGNTRFGAFKALFSDRPGLLKVLTPIYRGTSQSRIGY
jgi:hypothetical protein